MNRTVPSESFGEATLRSDFLFYLNHLFHSFKWTTTIGNTTDTGEVIVIKDVQFN